jgi:predicted amidophosphoribosyltransferase
MSILDYFRPLSILFKDISDLLYPRFCPGCSGLISPTEKEICLICISRLEMTSFELFPQNNALYYKFAGKIPIQGACSCFFFEKKSLLRSIVHKAKYKNAPFLFQTLGFFWGQRLKLSNFLDQVTELVPVPLHPKKQKARGYNQAEYLAKGIGAATGLPLNTRFLYRTINTSTQTRKNKIERWENVKAAFACRGVPPKLPLLIDDVITSGATTEAAALAMHLSGCADIKIGSLAFVR